MKSIRIAALLIFLLILNAVRISVFALPNLQETQDASETKTSVIVYTLPFPGILPNHPLYFLKTLRDALIEKMITNDVKKAEFYMLQADKRLQMSIVLLGSENKELTVAMRSDALMYREKSLTLLTKASAKNKAVPRYVLEKLLLSAKKHEEVLQDMVVDTTRVTDLIANIEALLKEEIDKK